MPYVFNPFSGSLDNAPSTFKGDSVYTTVQINSAVNWDNVLVNNYVHANFLPLSGGNLTGNLTVTSDISAQNNVYIAGKQSVTTPITLTSGTSAVTTIVAVSALPLIPDPFTLYIVI